MKAINTDDCNIVASTKYVINVEHAKLKYIVFCNWAMFGVVNVINYRYGMYNPDLSRS